MDKLTIPTKFLEEIGRSLTEDGGRGYWEYETYYGNKFVAKRSRGVDTKGHQFDCIEVIVNPED